MEGNRDRYSWIKFLIIFAGIVNLSGLFIPLLEPDAALYASIAKNMVLDNNYIELYVMQKDWLDKPHFPFWITALFFKVFGISTWSYKLPAILFIYLAAWYTYKFVKDRYGKERIALWATLIFLTAQHILLSNNDVRAEPYLTGLIMGCFYHFYKAHKDESFLHLLYGSIFAGCAVMTKGMFALFPIAGAFAGHFIITKQWKALFHWRWVLAAILTFICFIPELITLYIQFDLHPEKVVFGEQNVSGIKFFFWDSQFGRFFNTGPIKGKGDIFFFFHTLLWAFLPWSVLLYAAIIRQIQTKGRKNQEWYTLCGALFLFLIFSLSKFQLPHYLNIVFPFFSIITAAFIYYVQSSKGIRWMQYTQYVIIGLLLAALPLLHFLLLKPEGNYVFPWMIISILLAGVIYVPYGIRIYPKFDLITRSAFAILAVNIYVNLIFYPEIMKYQAGKTVAEYLNHNYPGQPVVQTYKYRSFALDFYLNERVQYVDSLSVMDTLKYKDYLLYIAKEDVNDVVTDSTPVFKHFHISKLNGKFLNPKTRNAQLRDFVLIPVKSLIKEEENIIPVE